MGNAELMKIIEQLTEYQVSQIRMMAEGFLAAKNALDDTTPNICPCCKSTEATFIKKGFSGRKQRYQCKACGRKFTYDVGKITAYSHQSENKWAVFIEDRITFLTRI